MELECGVSPHLILKHIISSDVSLAKLVSSSVALPAELVNFIISVIKGKLNVGHSLD